MTPDGVAIKASTRSWGWQACKALGEQAIVMGDHVLPGQEINPVLSKLPADGIAVTAIHNHLLRAQPARFYMRRGGGRSGEACDRPAGCPVCHQCWQQLILIPRDMMACRSLRRGAKSQHQKEAVVPLLASSHLHAGATLPKLRAAHADLREAVVVQVTPS